MAVIESDVKLVVSGIAGVTCCTGRRSGVWAPVVIEKISLTNWLQVRSLTKIIAGFI